MSKHLVIVESPAKAKTIEKYLGKDYSVVACYGHVRDLPSENMGVNLETFEPEYVIMPDKKKVLAEIKKIAKKCELIWLATDPDREGEAIAWHVFQSLKMPKASVKRIVFNEITKSAVTGAIKSSRDINEHLVNAQQARRILDRIVGYELSPILWKKLKRGLSAGRVQSVAVRIIVEREKEIESFKIESKFNVKAQLNIDAMVVEAECDITFDTVEDARNYLSTINKPEYTIQSVDQKESKRSPSAPFTTSTLQQEASSKLGYSVSKTMTLAQRLYESGHITYMRTDGTSLSKEAMSSIASTIASEFGESYVCPRQYATTVKGAQEAHEAIRPTNISVSSAGSDDGQKRLYDLIRKRILASQMAPAKLLKTTIEIPIEQARFIAKGEVVVFDGYLSVYASGIKNKLLPNVSVGASVMVESVQAREKFSKPPARFTEASLVRKLEALGIGRPSTYAPTITTIQKREYVERIESEGDIRSVTVLTKTDSGIRDSTEQEGFGNDKGKLQPTDIGIIVTDYLIANFERVMSYKFTADLETEFDLISTNEAAWKKMLHDFYTKFHPKIEHAESQSDRLNEERYLGDDPKTGKKIYAKIGRFGPFVQMGETDDDDKRSVSLTKGLKYLTVNLEEAIGCLSYPIDLGNYKNELVAIHIGRYGLYLKHGVKNYAIKNVVVESLDDAIDCIEAAIKEQSNKEIQTLKYDDEPLLVLNGRFGPYISFKKKNYKIPKGMDPKTLTVDQCVEIINTPKKTRSRQKK